jgi:hypothetical protein
MICSSLNRGDPPIVGQRHRVRRFLRVDADHRSPAAPCPWQHRLRRGRPVGAIIVRFRRRVDVVTVRRITRAGRHCHGGPLRMSSPAMSGGSLRGPRGALDPRRRDGAGEDHRGDRRRRDHGQAVRSSDPEPFPRGEARAATRRRRSISSATSRPPTKWKRSFGSASPRRGPHPRTGSQPPISPGASS